MLKRRVLAAIAAGLILPIAACSGGNQNSSSNSSTKQSSSAAVPPGSTTIAGSTALLPLVKQAAVDYQTQHPDAKISVSGGGSMTGITQAAQKGVDIGDSDVAAPKSAKPGRSSSGGRCIRRGRQSAGEREKSNDQTDSRHFFRQGEELEPGRRRQSANYDYQSSAQLRHARGFRSESARRTTAHRERTHARFVRHGGHDGRADARRRLVSGNGIRESRANR